MEIPVTDFSTAIGASFFKFCVRLQVGKVNCVNENKDVNPYFAFFFHFFLFFLQSLFYNTYVHFYVKDFSANS